MAYRTTPRRGRKQQCAGAEQRVHRIPIDGGAATPVTPPGVLGYAVSPRADDLVFIAGPSGSARLYRGRPGGPFAAIGLYAAFTHAVGQRRREMAVRIAVGASPGRVLRMILGEAARLACAGTVAGTIAALIAGRTLQALLFGIVPADPAVLGAAAATMLLIAVSATLPCARKAARSDPGTLLRAE